MIRHKLSRIKTESSQIRDNSIKISVDARKNEDWHFIRYTR